MPSGMLRQRPSRPENSSQLDRPLGLTYGRFSSSSTVAREPEATIFLADILRDVHGWRGRAWVLGVLAILLALVPLANASPPDPLWLGGIYDAADYDDVVLAAGALESLAAEDPRAVDPAAVIVSIHVAGRPAAPAAAQLGLTEPRAPPGS